MQRGDVLQDTGLLSAWPTLERAVRLAMDARGTHGYQQSGSHASGSQPSRLHGRDAQGVGETPCERRGLVIAAVDYKRILYDQGFMSGKGIWNGRNASSSVDETLFTTVQISKG